MMCEQKLTISQETYEETLARAMANPNHSRGCACERCKHESEVESNWPLRTCGHRWLSADNWDRFPCWCEK